MHLKLISINHSNKLAKTQWIRKHYAIDKIPPNTLKQFFKIWEVNVHALHRIRSYFQKSQLLNDQTESIHVGTRNDSTRRNWVISKLQALSPGLRILDAGAGEQKYRQYCSHLNYVAQDFAQYNGAGDGKGLHHGKWDQSKLDIVSDITEIPEPDSSFDAIMCIEVLEHVPDPLAAIKELSRLLKPKGFVILTAPFCSLTHFAPYHFSTGFSRYFYQKHLPENNLEIIEMEENGNFFEYIAQELHRLPDCAEKYTDDALKPNELSALQTVLTALQRLSQKDTASKELLCFGFQILAKKT